MGDGGNDALYGGANIDTLHGGDGDDNLYGDDGGGAAAALARNSTINYGHDVALGEAGSDWFEPTHNWARIDGNKLDREILKPQNGLVQDPNRGTYGSSAYGSSFSFSRTSAGTLMLGSNNTYATFGNITLASGGTLVLNTATISTTLPLTKSLGPAGWLVSGAWDLNARRLVPIDLSADQQQAVSREIVQLPAEWQLNEMSDGAGGLVWYRVSQPVTPPAKATQISVPVYHAGDLSATSGLGQVVQVGPSGGTIVINGLAVSLPPNSGFTLPVSLGTTGAVADTQIAQISSTTPGAIDGVENGQYRFLAVRRGTILIGGTGAAAEVKQWSLNHTSLALPGSGFVRIAGTSVDHDLAHNYRAAPEIPSAGLRGILVADGAIWLTEDGSSPFFTPE
jgi:hypothetical protein